jgi:methylmalonyl-CoA/ethylmalonyl-CoA epimerase
LLEIVQTIDDWKTDMRIHHVGFVVSNIAAEIGGFLASLQATWNEKIFMDPLQKVKVAFLRTPNRADAQIELVEPVVPDSPVLAFLNKGGGLHHLCYEVDDLDEHLRSMRLQGHVLVRKPHPAVAFENRRIAWTITKQKLLLEFLESPQDRQTS